VGNGVCPEKIEGICQQIKQLTTQNMDFRAVFSQLGASITDEKSTFNQLQDICTRVFMPESDVQTEVLSALPVPLPESTLSSEIQYLSMNADHLALSDHYLYPSDGTNTLPALPRREEVQTEQIEILPETAVVPAAGTVLQDIKYEGKALPANYTMNHISLGELNCVTPVLGHLNSEYGYRDHPINGKYLFHGGVDIGGQSGDTIAAFASGTVSYVGENRSYGLYLQLDHGNGVKSFYAHCKKICVKKGQSVEAGEKIAEVGSTGTATGPHLHLELKYNNMYLNPAYYLEFL